MVNIENHPSFTLVPNTNDLKVSISINLSEALLGFERVVLTHLDGRGLRVKSPPPGTSGHRVFSHGELLVIQGEGFPGRRSHLIGDLLAKIQLEMPTAAHKASLDSSQRLASPLPPHILAYVPPTNACDPGH